jgi:Mitochondrial carrier protein
MALWIRCLVLLISHSFVRLPFFVRNNIFVLIAIPVSARPRIETSQLYCHTSRRSEQNDNRNVTTQQKQQRQQCSKTGYSGIKSFLRTHNAAAVVSTDSNTLKHVLPTKTMTTIRTNASIPSPSSTSSSSTNTALMNGMKNAIASALAAACCKAILQPIDAMKTVQQYNVGTRSLSLYNAAQVLMQKPGGFKNLYAGLGVTMIGSMPSVGLYFGVYSYCKQRLLGTRRGRHYATASIALSAAIGNTVASITRVPYEVMKQNLQTGLYDTTWSMLRDMARHPSTVTQLLFPKGSVWIQMIRDVPYAVVTLLLYESLQLHFGKHSDDNNNRKKSLAKSPLKDAILGGFAGGVGSWVTNPMDVIKTRLQTDVKSTVYGGSIMKCCTTVWQEGGPSAFLRGSVPRLVHKVPANAFFFLFYEFFRRILNVS